MVNKLNVLDMIAMILVIIGGINWGLVALSPSYNLVELIFGSIPVLAQIIYLLVGISGLYLAFVMGKFARK